MTKFFYIFCIYLFIGINHFIGAQIQVHPDKRYLQTKDGKPFFWLGDTDWELFHRLDRDEIAHFMKVRAKQGFNIIQAVALAEFAGLKQPNKYGDLPLQNNDPTLPLSTYGQNPADPNQYDYWDHVEYAIVEAQKYNMYVGLLPTWGDKVAIMWGDGPEIFTVQNAEVYGTWISNRFGKYKNIIWILGGDRPAVYKTNNGVERNDIPIWRAMARGIQSTYENKKDCFIVYHPSGGEGSRTTQYLNSEDWNEMHAMQSSHGSRESKSWDWTTKDLHVTPIKPVIDLEPCYEDHPVNPWDKKWTRKERGYFDAYDVRARIYRGILAGQCGVTYGHHQIWQFVDSALYEPINIGDTIIPWKKGLHAEGAYQMQYLKNLMLSRPFFDREPNQSIVVENGGDNYIDFICASVSKDKSYAIIYVPQAKTIQLHLDKIAGSKKNIWYFNVRNGKSKIFTSVGSQGSISIPPPAGEKDWVVVIDDASKKYKKPGKI